MSAFDSYEEGGDLKLFCTASLTPANDQQGSQLNSVNGIGASGNSNNNMKSLIVEQPRQMTFEWRKNDELLDDNYVNSFNHQYHQRIIGGVNSWPIQSNNNGGQVAVIASNNNSNNNRKQQQQHMIITQMDDTASMLKIINLTQFDRANYTCTAKNKNGQDSSSVRIFINGEFI